jgi:predicted dehydrogenase
VGFGSPRLNSLMSSNEESGNSSIGLEREPSRLEVGFESRFPLQKTSKLLTKRFDPGFPFSRSKMEIANKKQAITNLAILGCGAITADRHLPAALAHPGVRVALLVDADVARAEALRRIQGLECEVSNRYQDVVKHNINAVINALPNFLHAPVNIELLSAGIHVLCEKPFAITVEEGRACCQAAESKGVLLAAAMPRRFYPSTTLVSRVLADGLLGSLSNYEWDHGLPFAWNTRSGFNFFRAQSGGGVLLDEGIHLLDCLLHWFGPVKDFKYQHDDWGGGIEANVILNLTHLGDSGELTGRIRLSRTYTLKNRLLLRGAKATAEVSRTDPDALLIHGELAGEPVNMTLRLPRASSDPFFEQLDDFVQAIRGRSRSAVTGCESLEAIELIQRCYSNATRIAEPWLQSGFR